MVKQTINEFEEKRRMALPLNLKTMLVWFSSVLLWNSTSKEWPLDAANCTPVNCEGSSATPLIKGQLSVANIINVAK